jgi:hypothetical protein
MTSSITATTDTEDYPTENGSTSREAGDSSYTWATFVDAILAMDATDSAKLTLTAVTAGAHGRSGEAVNLDRLEEATGKKRGTIQNILVDLASAGWLEKRAKLNGNRAVTEYVTVHSVNG